MINKYAKINVDGVIENVIISDDLFITTLEGFYVKVTEETGEPVSSGTYSKEKNKFAFKGFDSWIFDEDTYEWKAPVSKPSGPGKFIWNESNLEWEEVIPDPSPEE
jgi:hypothetical protein